MINFLIRILSYFARPIDGNPDEWFERPRTLLGEVWRDFKCGSVRGLYRVTEKDMEVLAVQNTKKNDHFDRVLGWFEKNCRSYKYNLVFLAVGNPRLKEKLERYGFQGNKNRMIKIYE